jgi:DNA-binding transcriptional LysR family regulator
VYELVAEDRVDIGLVSYPKSTRTSRALGWRDEPICLVCVADHALALRRSVTLRDLDGLPVVGFDFDLKIRREIDRELGRHGIELDVIMAFDNIDTIKHAIAVNSAASLLPEPAVRGELEMGSLVTVPVDGLDLTRSLGIIHRRNVMLGKTVQRFIEMLQAGAPSNDDADALPSAADGTEPPPVTAGAYRGVGEDAGSLAEQ